MKSILNYLGEWQLIIYHNYSFIALITANQFTAKTTFMAKQERYLEQIPEGYQPMLITSCAWSNNTQQPG